MGYRLNSLDEPIFKAVSKPLLTEFGIHQRLESCGWERTKGKHFFENRLYLSSQWFDNEVHKIAFLDLFKSHDSCFIIKALTLTGRPEKQDYRLRGLVVFWAS